MGRAERRKRKEDKVEVEEYNKFKTTFVGIVIMLVMFVGFYFLTVYLIERSRTNYPDGTGETKETYIMFNDIFTQDEEEYYVIARFTEDPNGKLYGMYFDLLEEAEVFHIDMDQAFNKTHISGETKVGEKHKDILVSDSTLFVIVDGKADSYYVGSEDIIKYLQEIVRNQEKDI